MRELNKAETLASTAPIAANPGPAEQVDAARLPYSELTPLGKAERDRDLYKRQLDAVDAALSPWKYTGRGRIETIERIRAASLKQETRSKGHWCSVAEELHQELQALKQDTQPPRLTCDKIVNDHGFVPDVCGLPFKHVGECKYIDHPASSPLETPAAAAERVFCAHCKLRIYFDRTDVHAPKWRHHGSNFAPCYGGLTTTATPAATGKTPDAPPPKEQLQAFVEGELLVMFDKDHKFPFSQVARQIVNYMLRRDFIFETVSILAPRSESTDV